MARISLPPLSGTVLEARHSGIREISGLALATPGAIRLEIGQPDFRTPDHIGQAAKKAVDEGYTFYTPTQGPLSLRQKLVAKLERVNKLSVDPAQIACGPGGVGAMAAALAAIVEAGDEVLLPDPAWPNYFQMAAMVHARPIQYPCPAENGFLPDLERLEGLISSRTRVLVVNSPHNPTGAVYPRAMLEALGALAERYGLWVISDECYDQIMLDGTSAADAFAHVVDDGRVASVYTFSKTYAMTGWRLGYLVADHSLVDSATKVLEGSSSCVSSLALAAAEAALEGPQDCVGEMVDAYRRRRDLVVDLLREAGLLLTVPQGAFYVIADVSPSGLASRDFALRLLKERQVAVAPGSAFGTTAAAGVRISLASSDSDLREGVGRICELVRELEAAR